MNYPVSTCSFCFRRDIPNVLEFIDHSSFLSIHLRRNMNRRRYLIKKKHSQLNRQVIFF